MDGVRVMSWDDERPPTEELIVAAMRGEGLTPHGWGNAPGDRYAWHEHADRKMLYCVRGSIIFHATMTTGSPGSQPGQTPPGEPGTATPEPAPGTSRAPAPAPTAPGPTTPAAG